MGRWTGPASSCRGDAIAGLIITGINLVGGIIMGLMRGMDVAGAVHTYSVLTIGDSLVSQMPAFIIAIASGILVTKATTKSSLGQEIGTQFMTNPRPLAIGAGILFCLAAVPGLAEVAVYCAGGARCGGRRGSRFAPPQRRHRRPAPSRRRRAARPVNALPRKPSSRISSTPIASASKSAPASSRWPNRITAMSSSIASPACAAISPRKTASGSRPSASAIIIQLDPHAYRFFINGREVARGIIRVGSFLALGNGEPHLALEGEATQEPAFGLPAKWITDNDKARAELAGYTVVDAVSVLITHLSEVLRKHAAELLGREDLKQLVDKVRETSPSLVDELIPQVLNMGLLHRVLILLLEEHVPISNMTRILECLANHAAAIKDPVELTERVRSSWAASSVTAFAMGRRNCRRSFSIRVWKWTCGEALHEKNLILEPLRLEKLIVCAGERLA